MIDESFRDAYRRAQYIVFTDSGELLVTIGDAKDDLDELLKQRGVRTAAFVTAFNPGSEVLLDDDNLARQAELVSAIETAGFEFWHGEGRDPAGLWQAESSALIAGIDPITATELAGQFGQNAYVWLEQGSPPELVWLVERSAT